MYHVNDISTLVYYPTKKYRVTNMNESMVIGTFTVKAKGTRYPDDDEENVEDGYMETYVIDIVIHDRDEGEELDHQSIRRAIRDTFTEITCQHEYDCCGCRSWHCYEVYHIKDGLWYLTVGSSRNY